MTEALFISLERLVAPDIFLLVVLGAFIGYWVGLVPGVGGIMAMALMLPVIATMDAFAALALLIGMYSVVNITSDLTAIVVGIPGTAGSAALVPDGYAMAKAGKAIRALSAAVLSSGVGALIGALVLLLSIPMLRPIVLALGAPQIFMMTVLGLSMVASLSGKNTLKGVAAAGLGLLAASVGAEAQIGMTRYGFNQLYLLEGLPLLPVVIGLFGIPELVDLHRKRVSIAGEIPAGERVSVFSGWRDVLAHRWLVVRSSVIGVVVGIIPGLGGAASSWMAYGHAVQSSKRSSSDFGTGLVEGVLAPGASNNSKEGGGLIPTIAFGIPGTGAMAVLLGGFLLIGITPGPAMVTNHLDVTYFMVLVLVAANLIGVALALATIRPISKITFVRGEYLVPFIIVFVLVGAMSATGHVGDLVTLLGFGVLAVFMRRFGWSVVPLLLGFILGDRTESSLWLSTRLHGMAWLGDPIVLLLLALSLATVYLAYSRRRRELSEEGLKSEIRSSNSVSTSGAQGSSTRIGRPHLGGILFSGALLVGVMFMTWMAIAWPVPARLFPLVVGIFTSLVLLIIVVVEAYRYVPGKSVLVRRSSSAGGSTSAPSSSTRAYPSTAGRPMRKTRVDASAPLTAPKEGGEGDLRRSALVIIGFVVAFAGAVWLVGLIPAMMIFVAAYYRVFVGRSWVFSVLVSAVGTGLCYLIFVQAVGVVLVRPLLSL